MTAAAFLALGAALVAARAEEPPLPEGLSPQAPAPAGPSPSEPALPEGLGGAQKDAAPGEPALPEGLGPPARTAEPALPEGIAAPTAKPPEQPSAPAAPRRPQLPFDLSGFWELRGGVRTQRDPYERQASIGETRLQVQVEKSFERLSLRLTSDFLYDPVLDEHGVRLEEGRGAVDLREAWVLARPAGFLDVKAGRQVLTWGTGDLLFLNDLFPKDWNAFLIGRDVEYLKAPSDALKVSLFSKVANLDLVYTPRFDADRFIDGRQISYYNPVLGRLAGRDAVVRPLKPDTVFTDDEIAGRAYRMIGAYEAAVYGYRGFWKSPMGLDPASGRATFPPLAVYGASLRGPVGKGIGNLEFAWYDSLDDPGGDDPFVPNRQWRLLAGYEQELAPNFTAAVQYYVEVMMDYGAYRASLPPGTPRSDRQRHVLTLRLTRLLMDQNLALSLFAFYSPTDSDAYLRPHARYRIDDHWSVEGGANVFFGNHDHTFFGQFRRDSNVYAAVRYSF
jgi:hypothetical protein